jgi:hypothetical protein
MFDGDVDKDQKANRIASTLANHSNFRSHGRHISVQQAVEWGLKVTPLEQDQTFQDLVLSVFHATTQTFDGAGAAKIVENQNGKAFVKQYGRVILQQGLMPNQPPLIPGVTPVPLMPVPVPTPQPQQPSTQQP